MDCGEGIVLSPEVEREVIEILESGAALPHPLRCSPGVYVASVTDKSVSLFLPCRHNGKVYKLGFKEQN